MTEAPHPGSCSLPSREAQAEAVATSQSTSKPETLRMVAALNLGGAAYLYCLTSSAV